MSEFSPDPIDIEAATRQAEVLAHALPFLRRYAGATVVVKYGGHAMGEEHLADNFGRDIALLTFGEPRVGNIYFAAFVRSWLPAAARVVHQDDAVPHLPPQGNELLLLTAFHHHAAEVWQTGPKDDTFVVCDDTGEDPRCSDSLLPWDRSVEAHRWYLGWPLRCSP